MRWRGIGEVRQGGGWRRQRDRKASGGYCEQALGAAVSLVVWYLAQLRVPCPVCEAHSPWNAKAC